MQMKTAALFLTTTALGLTVAAAPVAADSSCCDKVYREEIVINAAPSTIFGVILDLPHYGEWNPWLTRAEGDMVPGGHVTVDVVLNGRTQKAEHTVLTVEPFTRFCWEDYGWTTVFAPAHRCRTLEVQADGSVKLVNELVIQGALSWLVDLSNGAALRTGMAGENAGLKRRAESL
jgi:Polyketide cyclase / dehydrase and lipid transport